MSKRRKKVRGNPAREVPEQESPGTPELRAGFGHFVRRAARVETSP